MSVNLQFLGTLLQRPLSEHPLIECIGKTASMLDQYLP